MFTFVRFLAWAFYWMRLELAALQQPERALSVTRERGRWRVVFGETIGEARESWCAIRKVLEGREESEPLEFSPEALAAAADKLEGLQARERELELERARDAIALEELERDERERLERLERETTDAGDVAGELTPDELELLERNKAGF